MLFFVTQKIILQVRDAHRRQNYQQSQDSVLTSDSYTHVLTATLRYSRCAWGPPTDTFFFPLNICIASNSTYDFSVFKNGSLNERKRLIFLHTTTKDHDSFLSCSSEKTCAHRWMCAPSDVCTAGCVHRRMCAPLDVCSSQVQEYLRTPAFSSLNSVTFVDKKTSLRSMAPRTMRTTLRKKSRIRIYRDNRK